MLNSVTKDLYISVQHTQGDPNFETFLVAIDIQPCVISLPVDGIIHNCSQEIGKSMESTKTFNVKTDKLP